MPAQRLRVRGVNREIASAVMNFSGDYYPTEVDRALYQQCELRKDRLVQVVWIPKQYAKQGQLLQLRDRDRWINGWTVAKVYKHTITGRELNGMRSSSRRYGHSTDLQRGELVLS